MAYLTSGERFVPHCDFCDGDLDDFWQWRGMERICGQCLHEEALEKAEAEHDVKAEAA